MAACGGGGGGGGGSGDTSGASYSLGGNVSTLTVPGLVLSDGVETLSVPANASSFTFSSKLTGGSAYNVKIVSQPQGFTEACSLANASGTAGSASGTALSISCHAAVATVTTVAGNGTNGVGSPGSFYYANGVAVDATGDIYVSDSGFDVIHKVDASGVVTTLAGSGAIGNTNGSGTAASFDAPQGLAVDLSGNLYVADGQNHMIRKITPAGVVTTLAGSGLSGSADGTGVNASFGLPNAVAVDRAGNVYVTDELFDVIRKITPAGVVSTFAGSGVGLAGSGGSQDGTGIAASFSRPDGVATDAAGNVYVADTTNNKIRKITPAGVVTTIAGMETSGKANGAGTAASFYQPCGVAVDALGNIYVADTGNNVIRMITPNGVVSTLAGSGSVGHDDGVGTTASFYSPLGISTDSAGNVYVADSLNHVVRKISPQ